MQLKEFIANMSPVDFATFCLAVSRQPAYIRHLANRVGRPSGLLTIQIAITSGFAVTPHDLRPDLYPNPHDGLPPERRTTLAEAT